MVFLGASNVGTLLAQSTGNITDGGFADLAVTGTASFDAGALITLGDSAGNTATFGGLEFIGTDVTINEADATDLGGTSSADSLLLTSAGALTDSGTSLIVTGLANLSATAITLDMPVVDFGSLQTDTSGSNGAQSITETDGIDGLNLDAGTGNITLTSGGPLTDTDGVIDFTATDLILKGGGGVGTIANPLQTAVSRLDVANAVGGGISITNSGGLTLIDLDTDGLAVDGEGGGGSIVASSPLTISSDAITSGGMTYTAADSAAAGDDLTVDSGATVQDTTAGLVLNGGDDVSIDAGTSVDAATTLVINGDAGNADAAGSIIQLAGDLNAGTAPVVVNGNTDDDTITIADGTNTVENLLSNIQVNGGGGTDALVAEDSGDGTGDGAVVISDDAAGDGTITGLVDGGSSIEFNGLNSVSVSTSNAGADQVTITPNAVTAYLLNGNNPTVVPGDELIYDGTGTKTITGTNQGVITGGGVAPVSFSSFERVQASGGNSLDDVIDMGALSPDGTPNQLVVRRSATNANNLEILFDADTGALPGAVLISTQLLSTVNSLTIIGSGVADEVLIEETATGLPAFLGQSAAAHTNAAFDASGLAPAAGNIGINFAGGAGADSIRMAFLTVQDVAYFADDVAPANSGVVNVSGALTLSFENLAPLTLSGAGGSLLLDASSAPAVSTMTIADDATDAAGLGGNVVSGNGGFETTFHAGFDTVTVRSGEGSETVTLQGLDPASSETAMTIDADMITNGDVANDTIIVQSLPATVGAHAAGRPGRRQLQPGRSRRDRRCHPGPGRRQAGRGRRRYGLVARQRSSRRGTRRHGDGYGFHGRGHDGAAAPGVTYGDIAFLELLGGAQGNVFDVISTSADTTIRAGDGDDTVTIGNTTADFVADVRDGTLDSILGNVTIAAEGDTGAAGQDIVNVDDSGDADADVASIGIAGGLTRLVGFAPAIIATRTERCRTRMTSKC